jgi:hypothetical protein
VDLTIRREHGTAMVCPHLVNVSCKEDIDYDYKIETRRW